MSSSREDRIGKTRAVKKHPAKLAIKRFWTLSESDKEPGGGTSITVPDDGMSIKQIVERYTRGQRIPDTMMRNPAYDSHASFDSDDLEEVSRMDPVDKQEVRDRVKKDLDDKKAFFEKQEKAKATAEASQRAKAVAGEGDEGEYSETKAKQRAKEPATTSKKRANSAEKPEGTEHGDDDENRRT